MGTPVIIDMNTEVDFDKFTYPAGETQVRFKEDKWPAIKEADGVKIIARISSAQDIVTLALLNSALGNSCQYRTLVLPYLPYGRADRAFRDGDCAGLEVFGALVWSMGFDSILTLDAHNRERAEHFVPFLTDKPAARFIERSIVNFARDCGYERKCINVVFPDEGARTRYQVPARYSGNTSHVDTEIFHCSKQRDPITGSLLGFEVPAMPDRPTIIIDDICDGGGTFIGIARKLREHPVSSIGLYITHGIFSRGFGELNAYFDNIYTTDSIPQKVTSKTVTVYDCLDELLASR